MGFNGKIYITNHGKNYLASAQTGTLLRIKRLAIGDGQMGQTPIEEMQQLVSEKLSVVASEFPTPRDGELRVRADYSNLDIATGFNYRELGVYADQGDGTQEILYAYGNAGSLAEYIPPQTAGSVLNKILTVVFKIGNATNIDVVLDESAAYVLQASKATEGQAQDGTDNDVWMSAAGVKTHVDARIATPEEVKSGNSSKLVTAASLNGSVTTPKLSDGSVTFPKIAPSAIASEEDAVAGTVDNKVVTPAKTAAAIKNAIYKQGETIKFGADADNQKYSLGYQRGKINGASPNPDQIFDYLQLAQTGYPGSDILLISYALRLRALSLYVNGQLQVDETARFNDSVIMDGGFGSYDIAYLHGGAQITPKRLWSGNSGAGASIPVPDFDQYTMFRITQYGRATIIFAGRVTNNGTGIHYLRGVGGQALSAGGAHTAAVSLQGTVGSDNLQIIASSVTDHTSSGHTITDVNLESIYGIL